MDRDEKLVVVRFAPEMTTKSRRTRRRFQRVLRRNLDDALNRAGVAYRLDDAWSRLMVATPAVDEALAALEKVFGVGSFAPVDAVVEASPEAIFAAGPAVYAERIRGRSFAVRAKKLGRYPFSRMDLEAGLGRTLDAFGTVDLESPDVTVHVEVFGGRAYLSSERHEGPGGLPAGVEGRALALVSGGFDSPVAAWRLMRRGVDVDYLFCNLGGSAYERMVVQVVRRLHRRWGAGLRPRLHVVDFAPVLAELRSKVEPSLWQVVLKRLMYRAASRIAEDTDARVIVTGEAIGQVSSQTVGNLAAIEPAASLPVVRPLIATDKHEIVAEARRIGTASLSERVREYCALEAGRPAVDCTPARLDDQEAKLDPALIPRLVDEHRVIDVDRVGPGDLGTSYLFTREVPEDAIVIDCQPKHMYDAWHVPNAENRDPDELLLGSYRKLDKRRTYLLYCTHGTLTPLVAELMQESGYEAYAFDGGVATLKAYLEGRART